MIQPIQRSAFHCCPMRHPLPRFQRTAVSDGDSVHTSGSHGNVIVGPPQAQEYYRTFKDLDTGRVTKWPKELPDSAKAKGDEITTFAANEGFDLRGVEYKPPGSDRSYYALQALGFVPGRLTTVSTADRERPQRREDSRSQPPVRRVADRL